MTYKLATIQSADGPRAAIIVGERVIDVAGDGPDMRSLLPAPQARDEAVERGITVNALAIEVAPVTRFGEPLRELIVTH